MFLLLVLLVGCFLHEGFQVTQVVSEANGDLEELFEAQLADGCVTLNLRFWYIG